MRECESCGRCLDDDAAVCCGTGVVPTGAFAGPPLLDGKYLLERRLGAGGMGSVYRALHVGLGKLFAVKVIRPLFAAAPQAVARFRIEAMALGRLSHPNVVAVTDYGVDPRDGGLPYLVMEHLSGESLLDRLGRKGPLEPAEAVRLLAPVAAALDHAHSEGILHRDLKPSNVFLVAEPDGRVTPKLLDFGLARFAGTDDEAPLPAAEEPAAGTDPPTVRLSRRPPLATGGEGLPTALTAAEGIVGTPQFFAPELVEGASPSRATDLWALGVVGYAAVTGALPFEGKVPELLMRIVGMPPPPPSARRPGLDPALDGALLAPLARDPAARPPSASAWVRSVDAALSSSSSRSLRAREAPRRLLLASALATALALAVALLPPPALIASVDAALLDARLRLSPSRQADPRLLLVPIDEATLRADAAPLATKGEEASRVIEAALDAGASGVAVDLLLPAAWGTTPAFGRTVVARAPRLALAALSGASGDVVGPEALAGPVALALGPGSASLFAFANLAPDPDGRVRRSRIAFLARDGGLVPSFAARAAALLGARPLASARAFLVDYRVDPGTFERLPFHEAATALESDPGRAAGRLVLLGAEYEGSGDLHPSPREPGRPLSGLELQALSVQTLLDGEPLRELSRPLAAALLFPLLAAAAGAVLWLPPGRAAAAVGAALLIPPAAALAAFLAGGLVLPLAAPVAALAAAAGSAAALRAGLPAVPHPSGDPR